MVEWNIDIMLERNVYGRKEHAKISGTWKSKA